MRYAEPQSTGRSKLYDFLVDREEQALAAGGALGWLPEQPSYTGTPERLAALRAGEPVDLPLSALPAWARNGDVLHWTRRATVSADGTVAFRDDDGSAWLAENGL